MKYCIGFGSLFLSLDLPLFILKGHGGVFNYTISATRFYCLKQCSAALAVSWGTGCQEIMWLIQIMDRFPPSSNELVAELVRSGGQLLEDILHGGVLVCLKTTRKKKTNPNNLPRTQTLLIAMYSLQVVVMAWFFSNASQRNYNSW